MSEATRSNLQVRNASGEVVVRDVLRMVLYFRQSHQRIAVAINGAIADFVRLVSFDALRYYYDGEGEAQELTPESFGMLMHDWFGGEASSHANATIKLVGQGDSAPEYGLQYWGKELGYAEFPDDAGFLDLWMSRSWFLENAKRVGEYFRSTTVRTEASAAYVNVSLSGGTTAERQALAKRYAGLDIAEPEAVSVDLGSRFPGSYWINYFGAELTQRAGGVTEIRESLGSLGTVDDLAGRGALIRIGREPQLGDRNRREALPNHVAFARLLDSKGLFHVPRAVVYFEDEEGMGDAVAQEEWHTRFLEPRT
jgi:hypothetical protein